MSCAYPSCDVFIVDNNSNDGSKEELLRIDNITYIQNDQNLGYSGGNNVGIRRALESGCDYVLILNNDTLVPPDFLSKLVTDAEQLENLGVCGCKILDSAGRIWFGGGRLPERWGTTRIYTRPKYKNIMEVTFLTGCMLLVKKEVFERVGLFDERYFMYFEDAQFCYRVRQAGFKLYYNPNVQIVHLGGGGARNGFAAYFTLRNRRLFIKEQLQDRLLAKVLFYLTNGLKLSYFRLTRPELSRAILDAFQDFESGRFGAGKYEDLSG